MVEAAIYRAIPLLSEYFCFGFILFSIPSVFGLFISMIFVMIFYRFNKIFSNLNCNPLCDYCFVRFYSQKSLPASLREKAREKIAKIDNEQIYSPNSPLGLMDRSPGINPNDPALLSANLMQKTDSIFDPFPDNINPTTGEIDGPRGPEPTRYGDWENKGRCSDF